MKQEQVGRLICFTGVDGSGKTTQAMLLVNWLETKGSKTRYVWSRGEARWRRLLISLGRIFVRAPIEDDAVQEGELLYQQYQTRKSQIFKSSLVRWIWEKAVRVEHLVQIRLEITPLLKSGFVVVSDRYFWDSMVDLAVSFNSKNEKLIKSQRKYFWRLIPKPDLTFFLDVPLDNALIRKDDIPSPDYINQRLKYYQCLASAYSMNRIDGCMSIENIHSKVKEEVEKLIKQKGKNR